MHIKLSIIIPTRERALYLKSALETCTLDKSEDVEILVLDNASQDDTGNVVLQCGDARVKYYRSNTRLSMRDNFERGLDYASGDVLCFIGDDDGLLPHSVSTVINIFKNHDIGALSARRASYFWPDLQSKHANTARLPRSSFFKIFNSREQLLNLLKHGDYYRLPCLYHGFVRRKVVEALREKHGRFFLSSQPDIYSSISLSMCDIDYGYLGLPLVINGASVRSNGASHQAGGGGQDEVNAWKLEDDIGFLPGYENSLTINSYIIESALRYINASDVSLADVLDKKDCEIALSYECLLRGKVGRHDQARYFFKSHELRENRKAAFFDFCIKKIKRPLDLIYSFIRSKPIDCNVRCIKNISQASLLMGADIAQRNVGFNSDIFSQIKCALKIIFPRASK